MYIHAPVAATNNTSNVPVSQKLALEQINVLLAAHIA
jgi:hypothetical protein